MLVTHEREKLIQAINFFARNTRKFGKVKLFKLLYFLDFEHFKQTGRNVTGLSYNAWKMGPVPVSLQDELESPSPDMTAALEISKQPIGDGWRLAVSPRVPFCDEHFTKRELKILRDLATEYRNADAEDMIEATHLENLPWDQIWHQQGQRQAEIPYDLALRHDERDAMLRVANERKELVERLR